MEPLVTLDITTLTLGELASAERASGLSYQEMMRGTFSRLLLAMYVHELRNSDEPRSWSDLSNLRLLDASSSIAQSPGDGVPATSRD